MSDKVSDFLLKRLSACGIKRVYGYPGDGINGILGGLERNEAYTSGDVPTLPPRISFVQAKEYVSAVVKGDPEERGIIKQSVKSLVGRIFLHKDN